MIYYYFRTEQFVQVTVSYKIHKYILVYLIMGSINYLIFFVRYIAICMYFRQGCTFLKRALGFNSYTLTFSYLCIIRLQSCALFETVQVCKDRELYYLFLKLVHFIHCVSVRLKSAVLFFWKQKVQNTLTIRFNKETRNVLKILIEQNRRCKKVPHNYFKTLCLKTKKRAHQIFYCLHNNIFVYTKLIESHACQFV